MKNKSSGWTGFLLCRVCASACSLRGAEEDAKGLVVGRIGQVGLTAQELAGRKVRLVVVVAALTTDERFEFLSSP